MTDHLPEFAFTAALSIATLLIGHAWGQYRARKRWQKRDSFDRLHFSLNLFAAGELKIRTILERPIAEVVPNAHAQRMLEAAARRAAPGEPVLHLPENDLQFILNCILNVAAEHLGGGLLRLACGEPVKTAVYALCLTSEPVAERRQQKIRAVLIAQSILQDFPYSDDVPLFDRPWHSDRLVTMRRAAALYKSNPELFAHLELCV